MNIFESLKDIKIIKKKSVISIGVFDGVHLGHQHIINVNYKESINIGAESNLIIFKNNPKSYINKIKIEYLTTLEEKINLIKKTEKVSNLFIIPFTDKIQNTKIDDFINFLIKEINLKKIVLGYNQNLGYKNIGTYEYINKKFKNKINTLKIEPFILNNKCISSTLIRNTIKDGEIEKANKYLNYNYTISGKVIKGDKIGRQIGYPTANISIDNYKVLPSEGVYICYTYINNIKYQSLVHIGKKNNQKRIESYIFKFNKDIYYKDIRIEFLKKERCNIKFNNLDQLKNKISLDVKNAICYFESLE